jgi:crotonobetainyl-CoA:carnitine CoA-transferase CaiB-like acyl-CoA transferase
MQKTSSAALSGIRVLDLGRVVAAPYAAQLLGDLGADVIKVERPKVGDDVRAYVSLDGRKGISAHFASWNRNKRSITCDLSKPEGQQIVRQLAAKADVLLENYIPGTMQRYGLDYESLKALNPGLIYCSVSGYGHSGPYSQRGGMDHIFQARGGLMSVIGVPAGKPGAGPVMTGIVITDCTTGRDASCAILAALFERTRSGLGQHIDIALLDSAVGLLSHAAQEYLLSGKSPDHNARQIKSAWSGFLECADGKIFVLAGRDPLWAGLCRVLGIPDAPQDPRFSSPLARYEHVPEVEALIFPLAKRWKKAELAEALAAEDVLAGPVNNAEEVFADPQVQARGLVVSLPASYQADLRVVKSPLNLSRTPPTYRMPPPELGEHTREVLEKELGLDASEIEKLKSVGAI